MIVSTFSTREQTFIMTGATYMYPWRGKIVAFWLNIFSDLFEGWAGVMESCSPNTANDGEGSADWWRQP